MLNTPVSKSAPRIIYLKDYSPPEYLIKTVELIFDLEEEITYVTSKLTLNKNSSSPQNKLVLNGEALHLMTVKLNGVILNEKQYEVNATTLTILNVPEHFELEILTAIKPQENTALSGLYKSNGNFCTQCEAQGFRRITYFLDRPDVMALYTTKIIADKKRYPILLSNGNLIERGELENNKHWVVWRDPFKKPSYLFALVAGNFEFVEDTFVTQSQKKVAIKIFVEKGNSDKCAHAMQSVKNAMRWDEENFGREYDLDIYMIVAVSDFNMGAMENKGLNVFNTKYILARPETATDMDFIHVESVIGHEYFHNWSGNRITCRDWFQLSLKEGLTIFRDQSFTADMTSKTVSRIEEVNALRNTQFVEDAGPLAHPVQPTSYIEINNFYTSTVYNKGAEVIRMIQTIIGNEKFRQGMDLYFSRYDGQAVTIEEFVKSMEEVSQIDLTQFRLWYTQSGTPVLTIEENYNPAEKKYFLTIKQDCPSTPGQAVKKPFHIPIKIGLLDSQGSEITIPNILLELKKQKETFEFSNIDSQPIPSILRNFSAPVILQSTFDNEKFKFLFKFDTDGFNRWEAGQKYALNCIMRMISAYSENQSVAVPEQFLEVFHYQLTHPITDKMLLSRILSLPTEKYISSQMKVIDVDAIHHVREVLMQSIANHCKDLFKKTYEDNRNAPSLSLIDMGKRQLKNTSLAYLMKLKDEEIYKSFAMDQFKNANGHNMTDTLAALSTLVDINHEYRNIALLDFYTKWQSDSLVLDKWFSIQALSKLPHTLDDVINLIKHPAFDIKNPNKVYALIGMFCKFNLVRFHEKSGKGYQFLKNIILELNQINPQIAARMVIPLTEWRLFDETRQALMKANLEEILNTKHLSNDVYELVKKSL